MSTIPWFERNLTFGLPKAMLPFYLERLEGTIVRIEKKVKGQEDALLSTPSNGKWSIKQHIGHLAEVDGIANRRIREMLDAVPVMSPAVFEPQDYSSWPVDRVVNLFRDARQKNLATYRTIAETDLLKSSIHPRLKVPMTPVDLAWFDAEHDDHHLVKINEIIFTLTKTFAP